MVLKVGVQVYDRVVIEDEVFIGPGLSSQMIRPRVWLIARIPKIGCPPGYGEAPLWEPVSRLSAV